MTAPTAARSLDVSTLVTQLEALERLTRTEVQIAGIRTAQARTDAVRRELSQNAANGDRRARRIAAALRELDAVPDVVSPAVGRVLALVMATVEQTQPVEEALFSDLTLEHQLLDRARYVRTVAEQAGRADVAALADDLVTAHTATVEWITTVLAEEALGGPAALVPTPLQRVAGGVTQLVGLPARLAVRSVNRAVATVTRTGDTARDAVNDAVASVTRTGDAARDAVNDAVSDAVATVTRLGSDTREVAEAGRDAALAKAERVAQREGADEVEASVHEVRRDAGALAASELPIDGFAALTVQDAIAAIRDLDSGSDISAIIAFEEKHKNRIGVVDAAQTHFAALAKKSAGLD